MQRHQHFKLFDNYGHDGRHLIRLQLGLLKLERARLRVIHEALKGHLLAALFIFEIFVLFVFELLHHYHFLHI